MGVPISGDLSFMCGFKVLSHLNCIQKRKEKSKGTTHQDSGHPHITCVSTITISLVLLGIHQHQLFERAKRDLFKRVGLIEAWW
jgi:hypothetical protein